MTKGSLFKNLVRFSLPYLLSCFLQTFYGLADLFIIGRFNKAPEITAVAVGSQVMHMLTVMLVGLVMGSTVAISRALGAKDKEKIARGIGNTITLFLGVALILTVLLVLLTGPIIGLLSVPKESVTETSRYLTVCFLGIPFITAYNVLAGIFRGMGDSKRPMYFVAIAGILNVGLDWLLIGPLKMGAVGAAIATVFSQGVSVAIALLVFRKLKLGVKLTREDLKPNPQTMRQLLKVGVPIAVQDGFIQVSFMVITVIANRRGVDVAAAVGIVEKIISFLFLVPSAMLSTVSALAAQNAGAGKHERGREALKLGILITFVFGFVIAGICQFASTDMVRLFSKEEEAVIRLGGQYLRTYSLDCMIAGIHFCFSGYFAAYQRSMASFVHNVISVLLVRIPGAYLASVWYPETLYAMGLAAPLGSLLSVIICAWFYCWWQKKEKRLKTE